MQHLVSNFARTKGRWADQLDLCDFCWNRDLGVGVPAACGVWEVGVSAWRRGQRVWTACGVWEVGVGAGRRGQRVWTQREARTELEEQSVRVTIRNRPIGARVCVRTGQ